MKWTIRRIKESPDGVLTFDELIHVAEAIQMRNKSVVNLEPVQVSGYLSAIDNEIILHCQAKVNITLPSTRSLKPVLLQLTIPIKERYVYPNFDTNLQDYEETTIVLEHDYIDLESAVIDAILLNLPMRVLAEDEGNHDLPKGNDWMVLTEEDYKRQQKEASDQKIDERFAGLQSLFNELKEEE
ncbi:YceD family protein [Fundicoccus culcitae]|uniref:YceD family protein n=1 Tax=Fundicoccus culcitae TaxID=2969821 RepID=A0ABY5P6Z4_9LACT|nr:YceD family protein [Fundicoccus culcitae]UUX34203.1 YceD family protein [Fundicoccus culcitae]